MIEDPWNDGSQKPCEGCGQFHPRNQKWSDPDLTRHDAHERAFLAVCRWAKYVKQAVASNGAASINSCVFYWPDKGDSFVSAELDGDLTPVEGVTPPDAPLPLVTVLDVMPIIAPALVEQAGALRCFGVVTEAWAEGDMSGLNRDDELPRITAFGSILPKLVEGPRTNCLVNCLAYYDENGKLGLFAAVLPVSYDGAECVMDTLLIAEVLPGELPEGDEGPLTAAVIKVLESSRA